VVFEFYKKTNCYGEIMSHYRKVAIETFRNPGEPSSASIRARPLAGQGFSISMRVECSSTMRKNYPVGTVFVVEAQLIDKEGGNQFLYTHYNWPYEVVAKNIVEQKIRHKNGL
jgi:hypothetical protein